MRTLYLDCFSGISGDMFAGALLDLGADRAALDGALKKLALTGVSVEISEKTQSGLRGTDFLVKVEGTGDALHEGRHPDAVLHPGMAPNHDAEGMPHGHAGHPHRTWAEIEGFLRGAGLEEPALETALGIFSCVAEAESRVHGVPVGEVRFHEVGAADSIVDIVAAAALLHSLGPVRVLCSPLTEGDGTIMSAHGELPIPVPATAEILRARGVPYRCVHAGTELVTPTGAAIAATLAEGFGPPPPMTAARVGYGCGKRETGRPNLLRAFLSQEEPQGGLREGMHEEAKQETVTERLGTEGLGTGGLGSEGLGTEAAPGRVAVLEAAMDDCTGELLGHALEKLLAAGALDAYYTPAVMKKGRPGWVLTVLCRVEQADALARAVFAETTTIGLRRRICERVVMQREAFDIETKYGTIACKRCTFDGISRAKPEYESLRAAAEREGVPLAEVEAEAAGLIAEMQF